MGSQHAAPTSTWTCETCSFPTCTPKAVLRCFNLARMSFPTCSAKAVLRFLNLAPLSPVGSQHAAPLQGASHHASEGSPAPPPEERLRTGPLHHRGNRHELDLQLRHLIQQAGATLAAGANLAVSGSVPMGGRGPVPTSPWISDRQPWGRAAACNEPLSFLEALVGGLGFCKGGLRRLKGPGLLLVGL